MNELINRNQDRKKVLDDWKNRITEKHVKKDFATERMIIWGMWDFLTKDIISINPVKVHKKVVMLKQIPPVINAFAWRITAFIYFKSMNFHHL